MAKETWSRADLHIHSTYSDGIHDIPTILEHVASATDLRLIAITDHDCIEGSIEAQHLAPRYGLQAIPGQEVTTARGHLLALFTRESVPAGLSIPETVACVREQGGIAVLAHPYDYLCNSPMRHRPRPTWEEWCNFGVDGLETLNGSQIDPTAGKRTFRLAKRLEVAEIGGSDAHEKSVIGVAQTLFPGHSPRDLRRAILDRTCLVTGGRWTARAYLGWFTRLFVPRS